MEYGTEPGTSEVLFDLLSECISSSYTYYAGRPHSPLDDTFYDDEYNVVDAPRSPANNFSNVPLSSLEGNPVKALRLLDLHPGIINEKWAGENFATNDWWPVLRGETAIMQASKACYENDDDVGSKALVTELLKRGAEVNARSERGWDALLFAIKFDRTAVVPALLNHGADPNTRSLNLTDLDPALHNDDFGDLDPSEQNRTALGLAAAKDDLSICLLLIARAADLYAVDAVDEGLNALEGYGLRDKLTPAVLEQRRAVLKHAYDEGPHPNARWARRGPFVMVLVCYGFQPTAARRAVLLALNPPLPTDAKIPPIPIGTKEQYRAYLHGLVFSHPGFWKIIASYI